MCSLKDHPIIHLHLALYYCFWLMDTLVLAYPQRGAANKANANELAHLNGHTNTVNSITARFSNYKKDWSDSVLGNKYF